MRDAAGKIWTADTYLCGGVRPASFSRATAFLLRLRDSSRCTCVLRQPRVDIGRNIFWCLLAEQGFYGFPLHHGFFKIAITTWVRS